MDPCEYNPIVTGICGLTDWQGRPADERLVVQMWQAMAPRGAGRPRIYLEPGFAAACGEAAAVEADAPACSGGRPDGPGLCLLLDG